jgi:RNA polymerase sigma-70 factor (ECF subfamily)
LRTSRRAPALGPWLPEPLVRSSAEARETAESVSFAMMVALETLAPLERAVFVLGEAASPECLGCAGRRAGDP